MVVAMKYSGASRDEILKGKISWHNLVHPDEEQKWKCTFYPDAESLDKINKLKEEGLLNALRKDDEGYNMTFSRYRQKTIRGKMVLFEPPIVLDKDNIPIEGMNIGHGSDVTLKLQVYKYNKPGQSGVKGTAARMEAIRIDNLIPFDRARDVGSAFIRQSKGLVDTHPKSEAIF